MACLLLPGCPSFLNSSVRSDVDGERNRRISAARCAKGVVNVEIERYVICD